MKRDGVLIIAVVLAAAIILGNLGEQTGYASSSLRNQIPICNCASEKDCVSVSPPGQVYICNHGNCDLEQKKDGTCQPKPVSTSQSLYSSSGEARVSSRSNPNLFSRLLDSFFRNDRSSSSSYGWAEEERRLEELRVCSCKCPLKAEAWQTIYGCSNLATCTQNLCVLRNTETLEFIEAAQCEGAPCGD